MSTESLTKRPNVKEPKVHTVANTKVAKSGMKPRVDDSTDSMELTGILLPSFENGAGPVALGDLWNCRTTTVEGNLFDQKIDAKFLQADPIQSLDYTLSMCSSQKDVTDILKISASLAIELTGSVPIKVTGSGAFDQDKITKINSENIVVTYDTLTYQVRVRPSASEIVSAQVKKLLQDGTIVATHYVQAVLVGGKAFGSIQYSENVDNSNMHIKGDFTVVATIDPVTINAEAHFEKLDTELSSDYSTDVQVQAQPRFTKSPTTVAEMFAQVKEIDKLIENERHFPECDKVDVHNPDVVMRVTGVPIRFKLVPISHILQDHNVDPIFKMLTEELMNDFSTMLFLLKDYSDPQYFRMRLAKLQPNIVPILMDEFNNLTKEILKKSEEIGKEAIRMKTEAAKRYIEYKVSNGVTAPLEEMVGEYQNHPLLNVFNIESMLMEWREEAKKELAAIRASDVDGIVDDEGKPSIRFFTNKTDLDDWYNSERKIKVLLRTDYTNGAPTGVFLKLYDMSPTLARYGVEVGVAFPNVSEGQFSLTYKTQFETTVYESEHIRFVLEVLAISVDEGQTISKLFYSINAALSGLNLPMHEYLFDVPNLVTVMAEYKEVVISETYCDLLARLIETYDTWNFVFPIQALNTGVEMMRFFRQLRAYIPERFPKLRYKFLVGRFNNVSDKFYSPLVLLFKDDLVKAVCLDQLDILLMMEQLGKPDPDWDLLSFQRMRESCIYTPRADWAVNVVQNLILEHQTFLTDPIAILLQFPDNSNEHLQWAIEITRCSALRDEPIVLTTVAKLALDNINEPPVVEELEALLSQYGWKDGSFHEATWKDTEWSDFLEGIKNFVYGQAPFLLKVVLALEELESLSFIKPSKEDPPETRLVSTEDDVFKKVSTFADDEYTDEELNAMIDKIISFILEDSRARVGMDVIYKWKGKTISEDKIYEDIKEQVKSYNGMPAKIRRIGIMKIFEQFISVESSKDDLIHIFQLYSLIEGMASDLKSLKHVLLPMSKKYCYKLLYEDTIDETEYPRGQRRVEDSLTERQLFKTLGVLSEMKYNPLLYIIHQELFNFSTLPAPVNVKTTIEKMTNYTFNDEQLEIIWTNPKFLYALRQVMNNEGVLDTIITHLLAWTHQNSLFEEELDLLAEEQYDNRYLEVKAGTGDIEIEYPAWLPPDIAEKVKALVEIRKKPDYPYPKDWVNVELMIESMQIILARQILPIDFSEVLLLNVQKQEIHDILKGVDAMFYWNEEDKLFDHPWSLDTVSDAIEALKRKFPDVPVLSAENVETIVVKLNPARIEEKPNDKSGNVIVNAQWRKLVKSGVLEALPYRSYLELQNLHATALTEYSQLERSAVTTLKYISQQLKMNNGTAMAASFFEKYINYPPFGPRPGKIDFGDGLPTRTLGFLLTRGDIQTALFHLTDSLGTYLSLLSMAKTPIPLPLLITSIAQQATPKSQTAVAIEITETRLLIKALQDIIVPEMVALVPQPRLFRDPYRFVLTLRVGDTGDEMGRSSLINSHLMKDFSFFSSKNDPGSTYGRPLNRSGFLEFSWMSESTCDSIFWNSFVKAEYEGQRKEIIHLGLLHGDALMFPTIFEVIRPYVSSFVVFWKVANFNDLKAKKKALSQIIGTKKEVFDVVLYPDPTIVEKVLDQNLIFKQIQGGSQHLVNKAKLQNIFSDAIAFTVNNEEDTVETESGLLPATNSSIFSSITSGLSGTPKGAKPLSTVAPIKIDIVKPIATKESIALLQFIEKHSIGNIQDAFKREDNQSKDIVKRTLDLFAAVLNLPLTERDMALLHLTWELDLSSRRSSQEWKDRMVKLRAEINEKFFEEPQPDESWTLETQQEVRMSMEQFRRNTMSVQDLWRMMWTGIQSDPVARSSLLSIGRDFVASGYPVEMFHPTYIQDEIWGNGVASILENIPATTRIIIVSAFGLKSSGKSTLLNALFGQGFTEDSTTYGLQMRVVWLNEELRDQLDCDAFVIIDSEGVGGAENKIDEAADTLERKLVTFLLAISSVTLSTIIGPQLNELKDILEVSMSSLGKLDSVPLIPDIYLVQQYLPGMTQEGPARTEFDSSVQSAMKLTTDLELQIGLRVTEAHRLKQIKSRNKHAEVLHKISSRGSLINQTDSEYQEYCEDIRDLYSKIIHIAAVSRGTRIIFGDWFQKTKALWREIHPIEFPFKCPNTELVRQAASFDNTVDTVKRAIDGAFFYHEKKVEAIFSKEIDYQFSIDYDDGFDAALETSLIKLESSLLKVINACEDLLENTTRSGLLKIKQRRAKAAEPNPNSCTACVEAFNLREALFAVVLKQKKGFLVEEEVNRYTATLRTSIYERLRQGVIARQLATRKSAPKSILHNKLEEIKTEFPDEETQWEKFLQYASTLQTVIPARHRFHADLKEAYKNLPHVASRHSPNELHSHSLPDLKSMIAFDVQIYNSALESAMNPRKPEKMTWLQHDWLVARVNDIPKQMKEDLESVLYRPGMAREMQQRIHKLITLFEEYCGEHLLPNFKWEVHFYAIQLFSKYIEDQQNKWDLKVEEPKEDSLEDPEISGGNPLKVLRTMKNRLDSIEIGDFFLPVP